jgi:hypothetical protein
MKINDLLAPMGISAYVALALAFLTGILKFRFHVKWLNFKWHIWLGVLAVILGTVHLLIAIYVNL